MTRSTARAACCARISSVADRSARVRCRPNTASTPISGSPDGRSLSVTGQSSIPSQPGSRIAGTVAEPGRGQEERLRTRSAAAAQASVSPASRSSRRRVGGPGGHGAEPAVDRAPRAGPRRGEPGPIRATRRVPDRGGGLRHGDGRGQGGAGQPDGSLPARGPGGARPPRPTAGTAPAGTAAAENTAITPSS